MKESIFFNREQLKIINWYNILYQGVFKYGVGIAAGILSLVGSWGIFASGYFSSIYLLEKQDEGTVSQAQLHYQDKENQVATVPGLEGVVLNGKITINDGRITAQDVLLVNSGLTLPRLTDISLENLDFYTKGQNKESFTNDYMSSFFHTVLINPLSVDNFGEENPSLFEMPSSMTELFGLGCTITRSKESFVCKSYINSFLSRFYLYDLSNSIDEINQYFTALKTNNNYKKSMCEGLLRYGKYSDTMDNRLSELFRNCGSEDYNQFILLRDFLALAKPFSVGYVETTAYTNRYINEYKLYSLQQLLYKELSASADVKSTMQTYLGFIREVLTKEGSRQEELLSPFAKSFTYWYNMTILSPYFKDEDSKMDKDDRTSLNSELLALNYGDTVANFKGLQTQSRYIITSDAIQDTGEKVEELTLKDIFTQSYMPANFNIFSIETGDDENLLIVKGLDLRTEFILEALLRYENLQLSVINVKIDKSSTEPNEILTNYINGLIQNTDTNYSLNQTLSLMFEYKDFTDTPGDTVNLCDQLEDKYAESLLSCEPTIIEMIPKNAKEDDNIVYTFYLQNGALTNVSVNNELLETQILNALDLSHVDAASTYHMITSILAYKVDTEDTGFGMRDYLAVSETITKYLGESAEILTENGEIKIKFSAGGANFIATYDMISHQLNPMALDFGTQRRSVIVQGLSLTLDDSELEKLNEFMSDSVAYIKKINPALVNKYFSKK